MEPDAILATEFRGIHSLIRRRPRLASTILTARFDRLASRCYPNESGGGSSATDCDEYDYNPTGTVSRWTQRDDRAVNYAYDRLDRLVATDYPSGTPDVTFAYDDLNRMTQAAQPAMTIDFTYDQLGRLLREHNNLFGAVESTYRVDGVRTHIEYPDGAVFEIARNQAGAPEAMFEGAAGSGPRIGRWNYDALNRVGSFDWGQNPDPGRSTLTLGYDAISRLSSLANDLPAAASPGDVTIGLTAYNPASQIVTRTRNDGSYAFDDPVEGATDYSDPNVPTPNGLNQYVSITGARAASLDYDDRGNLTSYDASGSANDRAYAYNARNLMTSASLAGGSATTLGYDPLGRLFQVNAPGGTTDDRRYLWDGDAIIAELNPTTGAILRRFVHAPGSLGAPIAQYEGASVSASSRRYLQTDERGSVISAVESDDGTQAATNSYDPLRPPRRGQQRPVPVCGPAMAAGDGNLLHAQPDVRPGVGAVHAGGPDRICGRHEPVCLCGE